MLDILWLGILGGVLIGAVALALAGLPLWLATTRSVRDVLRRQDALEGRIEDVDDRITIEQKRRASEAGVEARRGKKTLDAEVLDVIAQQRPHAPPAGRPGLLKGLNRGSAP